MTVSDFALPFKSRAGSVPTESLINQAILRSSSHFSVRICLSKITLLKAFASQCDALFFMPSLRIAADQKIAEHAHFSRFLFLVIDCQWNIPNATCNIVSILECWHHKGVLCFLSHYVDACINTLYLIFLMSNSRSNVPSRKRRSFGRCLSYGRRAMGLPFGT